METAYHQKRNNLAGSPSNKVTKGQVSGTHWLRWEEAEAEPEQVIVSGRWICRVTTSDCLHSSEAIDHFPAPGYGLQTDGSELSFRTKKAARRFAAKCAIQWLVAQGLMTAPSSSPMPSRKHAASEDGQDGSRKRAKLTVPVLPVQQLGGGVPDTVADTSEGGTAPEEDEVALETPDHAALLPGTREI